MRLHKLSEKMFGGYFVSLYRYYTKMWTRRDEEGLITHIDYTYLSSILQFRGKHNPFWEAYYAVKWLKKHWQQVLIYEVSNETKDLMIIWRVAQLLGNDNTGYCSVSKCKYIDGAVIVHHNVGPYGGYRYIYESQSSFDRNKYEEYSNNDTRRYAKEFFEKFVGRERGRHYTLITKYIAGNSIEQFFSQLKQLPITAMCNFLSEEFLRNIVISIIFHPKVKEYLLSDTSGPSSWLLDQWKCPHSVLSRLLHQWKCPYIAFKILCDIIQHGVKESNLSNLIFKLVFKLVEKFQFIDKINTMLSDKYKHECMPYMLYILLFYHSRGQPGLRDLWDSSNPLELSSNGGWDVHYPISQDVYSNNGILSDEINYKAFLLSFVELYKRDGYRSQPCFQYRSQPCLGEFQNSSASASAIYVLCLLADVKTIREYMYANHSEILPWVWDLWKEKNGYSSISSYILAKLILNEDFKKLLQKQDQVISELLSPFISPKIDDHGCERNYILHILIQIGKYPDRPPLKAEVGTYVIQNLDSAFNKFLVQGKKEALYLLALLYTKQKFNNDLWEFIDFIVEVDKTPDVREFFNIFKSLHHSQIERFFNLIHSFWVQAKGEFDDEKTILIKNIVVVGGLFRVRARVLGVSPQEKVSDIDEALFEFLVNINDLESNLPLDKIDSFFRQHKQVDVVITPYMENILRSDTWDMPFIRSKLYCLLMIDLFYDLQGRQSYQNDSASSWFFKDIHDASVFRKYHTNRMFLEIILGTFDFSYEKFFETFRTFVEKNIINMNDKLSLPQRLGAEQIITNLQQKMAAIFQSHCKTAEFVELFNVLKKTTRQELSSEVYQISEDMVRDLTVLEVELNKLEKTFVESLSPNLFQNLLQQTIRFIVKRPESFNEMLIAKRISLVTAFYNIIEIYKNTHQSGNLKKPYTQLYIHVLRSMSVEEGKQYQELLKTIRPPVTHDTFVKYAGDVFTELQSNWPDIVGSWQYADEAVAVDVDELFELEGLPEPSAPLSPLEYLPPEPSAPPPPPYNPDCVKSGAGSADPDCGKSGAGSAAGVFKRVARQVGQGPRDPALKPPGPPRYGGTGLGSRIFSPGSIGRVAAAVMNRP